MRNYAGPRAAAGEGEGREPEALSEAAPVRRLVTLRRDGGDLHDAWRLAYVVVADTELASRAVSKAFVEATAGDPAALPSRVELLEGTLRISLTRAAEHPPVQTESDVTVALWRLSPAQRAALWLTTVHQTDNATLGAVIGLTSANAAHVAGRAKEWLDVALDHESGPLCEREVDLEAYAGGSLGEPETKAFTEHLPTCPTCRRRLRAGKELQDLKAVLDAAVPQPPDGLTVDALRQEEELNPDDGIASLAGPARTPALRPLALCCAALLLVAILAIAVMHSGRRTTGSPGATDPRAILPNAARSAGAGGSSATLPPDTVTTIAVTTTTVPTVTFPTLPSGSRKAKP
jgi:hypothetical protein